MDCERHAGRGQSIFDRDKFGVRLWDWERHGGIWKLASDKGRADDGKDCDIIQLDNGFEFSKEFLGCKKRDGSWEQVSWARDNSILK